MTETIVDEIRNVVLLFSNAVWGGDDSIPSTVIRNITAISSQIAYSAHIQNNITVLSSEYSQTDNGIIQGLLYVPDIAPGDSCTSRKGTYVPSAAVSRDDLPPTNYNLVAIAPWIDAECSKAFLSSAATDPLRAFIFYQPDNSTNTPPSAGDAVWNMNDGGAWRKKSRFPIYAVCGAVGSEMMTRLSQYSGSLDDVPFGDNITAMYNPDPEDYVRIWTEIKVRTPTGLPTMWIFILAVIGLLLLVIAMASLSMHYIQYRRRRSLERRVRSGEVNLEAMGIKRMTVPLEHVEAFPLFTYNYEPDTLSMPASPAAARAPPGRRGSRDPDGSVAATNASSEKASQSASAATAAATGGDQPTCHICLRNYQKLVTIIRELPCGHIFHPDCVDEFLGNVSSLCPVCKASVLPPGYCPCITNAMVRRERAVRKLRDCIVVDSDAESITPAPDGARSWSNNVKQRLGFRPGRPAPPPPPLGPASPSPAKKGEAPTARKRGESPTEATRERMRVLAGADLEYEDGADTRPRWKRIFRHVFPGFS